MKRKRTIFLLLSLSLICTTIVPGRVANAGNGDSGMAISKTATENEDGTYTIELEAYATGETIITEITQDVPTDIVLVLDQSGSMSQAIGTVSFKAYPYGQSTNSQHYDRRHNGGAGNLWYPLADGGYASVFVARHNILSSGLRNVDYYYYYQNSLYEKVGDEYKPVTLSMIWVGGLFGYYRYTYVFVNGDTVVSEGSNTVPDLSAHEPLYTDNTSNNNTVYTYTYTDAQGTTQTIGTSTGATTKFDTTLYERIVNPNAGGSRLAALKTAVTNFANSVATKAAGTDGALGTDDDVNHRVAVVGFASQSGHGNNTELLSIAGTNSGSVGVAYNNISPQNLIDVLQDMDTTAGQTMVTNAVNALAAQGATEVDLGMDMAQRILNANPVPAGQTRSRVVVVFTDGAPTSYNGFEKAVATAAISTANGIKGAGATVYAVGVFSGADATSPGTEPSGNLPEGDQRIPAASNWFMQNLSSNNGTPRSPSYYLSAADAATLNNIFQQISEQIEEGGTETTLGAATVIRDIISPYFTLPAGATADDITLETWQYKGPSYDAPGAWSKNTVAMGATAVIGGTNNNQLSITGFDFCGNYAGSVTQGGNVTYRGHKLVIKFTVEPRPGFLGGNGVGTNTSAGVYEDAEATAPVLTFDQPEVDVDIPDITITTPSETKNVYLLQDISPQNYFAGVSVTIGGVSLNLDPNAVNWGLEPWQSEYIDISVTYADAYGEPIEPEDLQDITEDTSYSVTVTVEPNKEGTEPGTGYTQTGSAAFNVFKPELTFADLAVYYGGDAPADTEYAAALTGTLWKRNGVLSTEVVMTGTAPDLALTYTPEAGKIEGGKVNTKQDIKVDAAVKIGEIDVTEHTTFLHTPCDPASACSWNEVAPSPLDGSPAFLLHVNTCTLTVTKAGGAGDASYVFDVYKDGTKYSEATIWGNGSETLYELPVGVYTIQENTGWSWRYSANNGSAAALAAGSPTGSITCTNSPNGKNCWLNGYSEVACNISGVSQSP